MKKILALLLSLAMVLCMMPSIAFAADTGQTAVPEDITGYSIKMTEDYTATSLPYNGKVQNPVLGIEKDTEIYTLQQLSSAGYEVVYSRSDGKTAQVDAGYTTVTIKKKDADASENQVTGQYNIAQKEISHTTITEGYMAPVAAGDEITADNIKLKDSETGKDLIPSRDFTVSETTVSGTAGSYFDVTVTGAGNYKGTRIVKLSIGADLNSSDITVTTYPSKFIYNGKEQTFSSVTVTSGTGTAKKTLVQNQDYVISYKNNVNAGTAHLVIEGRGAYAGHKEVSFTIEQRSLSSVSVEAIPNQEVNGRPHPVIKDTGLSGSPVLTENIDYDLEWLNNEKAGTATLIIRAKLGGNYTGYLTKYFHVCEKLNITVTPSPISTYTYTGSVITPNFTVTSLTPGKTYVLNRDYEVRGGSNINAGTYQYYIVGKGSYAGEFGPFTYTITPRLLSTGTLSFYGDSFIYTGRPVEPSVTVTCGGRTLVKDVDYTLHYSGNNRIGTASVIVYGKGNYTGSLTKTFRIIGKDISSVSGTLSQSSYKYDGLEKKPAVTLYDGTKKLTAGIDYTVSYRNNRNAGTGEVIVTGKGNYGGTKTLTFRIIGKEQKVTSRYSKYYRTPESDSFNLNADHDGDGYLVYSSSDTSVAEVSSTGRVTVKGTGRAVITVSTAGTVRYEPASKRITIDVRPVTPAVKAVSAAKGKVKVTITKVEGATKYQVKYGRNGKYKNRYITHRDNEYVRIISTIKNLPSKTHYIKVRAYKTLDDGTKIWGKWVTKKIKVK